jgi:hypothetical protein
VARITAEFVKQGDSPAPSKPAQPAKPDTNGAPKEALAVVVEAPKPAAQQQDALADLQDLRKLIDEVRAVVGCVASVLCRAATNVIMYSLYTRSAAVVPLRAF